MSTSTDSTRDDPFGILLALIDSEDPDAPAFTHAWTPGGSISIHDLQQMAEDWRDGAALRRLREALPGKMVEVYGPHPSHGRFLVQVVGVGWDAVGIQPRVIRCEAATIAEAADKCRETLG